MLKLHIVIIDFSALYYIRTRNNKIKHSKNKKNVFYLALNLFSHHKHREEFYFVKVKNREKYFKLSCKIYIQCWCVIS